jgi:lysyl-tRNA synthetase class 2
MKLSEELIIFIAKHVNGTCITHFNGHEINLGKWTKLSMREAIIKFWPRDLSSVPEEADFSSSDALKVLVTQVGTQFKRLMNVSEEAFRVGAACSIALTSLNGGAPYGKAVADIFEAAAEPHLIQPTIIYDFPLAVSPLSKKKPNEPDWVERFEFYIGGFEVGNAFSELNDPVDQLARFEQQMTEKERGDSEAHQMDEDYVRALGYGLPPTAGEGIGIDRLTMLLTDSKSIRDVILFPLMRPQQKTAEQLAAHVAEPHGESVE